MIYRVVTYDQATEQMKGTLPVPPSVLNQVTQRPPSHPPPATDLLDLALTDHVIGLQRDPAYFGTCMSSSMDRLRIWYIHPKTQLMDYLRNPKTCPLFVCLL